MLFACSFSVAPGTRSKSSCGLVIGACLQRSWLEIRVDPQARLNRLTFKYGPMITPMMTAHRMVDKNADQSLNETHVAME